VPAAIGPRSTTACVTHGGAVPRIAQAAAAADSRQDQYHHSRNGPLDASARHSAMIPRGQASPPTRVINTARVREYIAMRRILQALVAVALAVFVVDSGCSSNRDNLAGDGCSAICQTEL
jgi:hypothetical protein